jgi:hypothetical protein
LRLLIKRKHFTPILFVLLSFPTAALAADGDGEKGGPAIAPAKVAPALPWPIDSFHDVVKTIAADVRAEERALARKRQRQRQQRLAALGVSMATLEAIASCESGGDPTIVSSDGSYRGKYQFSVSTWESVGGSGDPAAAPETEQDYRAALLYSQAGSSPWPVCG